MGIAHSVPTTWRPYGSFGVVDRGVTRNAAHRIGARSTFRAGGRARAPAGWLDQRRAARRLGDSVACAGRCRPLYRPNLRRCSRVRRVPFPRMSMRRLSVGQVSPAPARRRHGRERQRQVVARVRRDPHCGAAPARRDVQHVRPPPAAAARPAGGRGDPQHLALHRDRPEAPRRQQPRRRRHGHRDPHLLRMLISRCGRPFVGWSHACRSIIPTAWRPALAASSCGTGFPRRVSRRGCAAHVVAVPVPGHVRPRRQLALVQYRAVLEGVRVQGEPCGCTAAPRAHPWRSAARPDR